jgi:hypothetical protein
VLDVLQATRCGLIALRLVGSKSLFFFSLTLTQNVS